MNYECLHEYSRNTHSHLAGQKQVLAEATITMVLTVLLSSFRFLVYCDYVGFTWFFTVNTEWLLLSGSASFPFTSYNLIYTSFCIFYLETGLTKLLRLALNSLCGPDRHLTCYPPVSTSQIPGTGLQAQLWITLFQHCEMLENTKHFN